LAERVLTTRELNRALLARQLLLEPSDLGLTAAIEQVGGLQTQYSPSGYVGLWSRLRDFRRESLTEALEERRVIQATLLRATIHMVSAADYPLMAAATRPARAAWLARTLRKDLAGIDMERVAETTRAILAGGPKPAAAIQAALEIRGYPRLAWVSVAQWVDMVRVPPSGTWRRRKADLYGLATDWLAAELAAATEAEGLELLVRRYLGAFGPAPLTDIAMWAGVPAAVMRPAAERLDLRRFRDEAGRELLDLREAPLPDAGTPAPVRFLPTWDATLLVHARRTLIVAEDRRPLIFNTKTPHSVPTFLVDGTVAGTWRYERGRVEPAPFEELPAVTMRALEAEAERLAEFHAD
jgi:Winged helix DNA-binding domain